MICVSRLCFSIRRQSLCTANAYSFVPPPKCMVYLHAVAPSSMNMVVKFPLLIGNRAHTYTHARVPIDVVEREHFILQPPCVCVCYQYRYNMACMHNANPKETAIWYMYYSNRVCTHTHIRGIIILHRQRHIL